MVGMTLGLATNISTIHMITQPQPVDPPKTDSSQENVNGMPYNQAANNRVVASRTGNQVNSDRLAPYEQDEIAKMLNKMTGQSLNDLMHQDGTVNTEALEKSIEEAKLKRATELVGAM